MNIKEVGVYFLRTHFLSENVLIVIHQSILHSFTNLNLWGIKGQPPLG